MRGLNSAHMKGAFCKESPAVRSGARYRDRLLALVAEYQETAKEILYQKVTELRPHSPRTLEIRIV
jgi:hypothetical protein